MYYSFLFFTGWRGHFSDGTKNLLLIFLYKESKIENRKPFCASNMADSDLEKGPMPLSADENSMEVGNIKPCAQPSQDPIQLETATPSETLAVHLQITSGSKGCGCCYSRRAVIIINILNLMFLLILLIAFLGWGAAAWESPIDDETTHEPDYDARKKASIVVFVGFLFTILGLVGASIFDPILIGANIFWMVIEFVALLLIYFRYICYTWSFTISNRGPYFSIKRVDVTFML